ncbi:hypothetical protein [Plastoroseomonas hellenica]|uniref:hypothetical protein n=1 Tax=Plastoroseomonas hellenica TaxID=2687306 RepID=UPI001BAC3587|nr:hypothetical protein [Plastoroseomonas hellenica]MBR0642925.1 hypothetical protein [Plastoroseomonas hellenica]
MSAEPSVPTAEAAPINGLPLWEAAARYCAKRLVKEHQAAFDNYRSFLIGGSELELPRMRGPGNLTLMSLLVSREVFVAAARRHSRALADLETDFRRHIAAGTVSVWGVQVEPTLDRHRTRLSWDWGDALEFDWENNAVVFGKHRFASISCAIGPGRSALAPASAAVAKRSPGRPTWPIAELIEIARGRQRQRPAQVEARELLAIFRKRHPDLTPPAEDSIKIKLGKIYRAAKQAGEQA